MNWWIIFMFVLVWMVLSAIFIISACMQSSRLSQAEQAHSIRQSRVRLYRK